MVERNHQWYSKKVTSFHGQIVVEGYLNCGAKMACGGTGLVLDGLWYRRVEWMACDD